MNVFHLAAHIGIVIGPILVFVSQVAIRLGIILVEQMDFNVFRVVENIM